MSEKWPLPKFYFKVSLDSQDTIVFFQEVTGLDFEPQPVAYKHGDSKQFSTIKMRGIAKTNIVTLKKGVFEDSNNFRKWYEAIQTNTINRETVSIHLMDEEGKPTMTWKLSNAYPIKITGTDIRSDASEVAVESLELAHEGLSIENGG